MNKILQKELRKHLRIISGRKAFLQGYFKSINKEEKDNLFRDKIEGMLHLKVKEYLDKNNFDYEKGRNKVGSRITFENGRLKVRQFKCHGFSDINVLNSPDLNEFVPDGLKEGIFIINNKFERLNKVTLKFRSIIKLRKGIPIQFIKDNKIETDKVIELELANKGRYSISSSFEVKIDLKDSYLSDEEDGYSSDEVFNKVLELKNKLDRTIKNVEKAKEGLRNEIKDIVEDKIDKMIILGELR